MNSGVLGDRLIEAAVGVLNCRRSLFGRNRAEHA